MGEEKEENKLERATRVLARLQNFDVSELPREQDLGKQLSFADAQPPAEKLVSLYQLLSVDALSFLPEQQLDQVANQAEEVLKRFDLILSFNPKEHDQAFQVRDQYVTQLRDIYQKQFNVLHPIIAFGLARSTDLNDLERRARLSIQGIDAKTDQLLKDLEETREKANKTLEDVRKTAAEQGVSKHAIYFGDESEEHKKSAKFWRFSVIGMAVITIVYAIASLFFHLAIPTHDIYQSVQLVVSKILIFAVLLALFLLAIKNFLSHTHNEIVNRHRQNALRTYQSLVDATPDDSLSREIVLSHAAACIYAPQETGYARGERHAPSSGSEYIPRPVWRFHGGSDGGAG